MFDDQQNSDSTPNRSNGDSEETGFTPDPSRHIHTSDPRLPGMLEAGRALRGSFPEFSDEQALEALKKLPEWIKGSDVVEGLGLEPKDLSHCMLVGLPPFSNEDIGREICHPWGVSDEMRRESRTHLMGLSHRDTSVIPPGEFNAYGRQDSSPVPEWQCLTITNPDNPAESASELIQRHLGFLFRTIDVLKFQQEFGFPVCIDKFKRYWKNLTLKVCEYKKVHIKSADGKWTLVPNGDHSTLQREVDQIARRARVASHIQSDHLALIFANEAENTDVLPALWKFFHCNKASGIEEVKADTISQRIEAWYYLLDCWLGVGVFYFPENRSGPEILIDQYRLNKKTGKFELVDRERGYYPYQLEDPMYVKLDDFKEFTQNLKEKGDIRVTLPATLFPGLEAKTDTTKNERQNVVNVKDVQLRGEPTASHPSDTPKLPFPCTAGTRWEDISFAVKSDELVYVKTPRGEARVRYDLLGFSDKRKGDVPNKSTWPLFLIFARYGGTISRENPHYDRRLSDNARLLNKRLKEVFQIKESIFTEHYKKLKRYKTRFQIRDERTTS